LLEPQEPTPQAELAMAPLEHFRMLPPLRGSRESLLRQNERADQEGLTRVADDQELEAMSARKELVPLPVSAALHADPRLELNRRYCRPWAARFLVNLANAYYARFRKPLQVNSAVRTVAYQKHLLLINGNAAPAEGDTRSPHLTGEAVDIGKKGLSSGQIGWMRAYLSALQAAGKLDVEEEFEQACFHISVYKSYAPAPLTEPRIEPRIQTVETVQTVKAPRPRSRHHRTAAALLATRLR
jgi:Family of unknown function (DUF5715)